VKTETVYYVVFVKLKEARAAKEFGRSLMTADGADGVLSWSNEGGGWPQITTGSFVKSEWGHRFETPPTPEEIMGWDGMPWMCKIKPGSARIVKVTERFERIEEDVTP